MTDLSKRPEETELEHHKRLIYGKLLDGTLADADYTELAPYVYGREYSTDAARKMMYGSVRTLRLMDVVGDQSVSSDGRMEELAIQKLELEKERQKLSDEQRCLQCTVAARSRQEELNEIIRESCPQGGCQDWNMFSRTHILGAMTCW